MKAFLSVLFGFIDIPMILFFFMVVAFAAAPMGGQLSPVADMIVSQFLWIIPMILLGLHVYGQILWWSSNYTSSKWLPITYMLSAAPANILIFVLVFTFFE